MPEAGLVPTCVVIGPPGSGKTALMRQWARQAPVGQRWTLIQRGVVQDLEPLPAHVLALSLSHDCACCSGRVVLQTHLGRTLRLRRPDRLFIEADQATHLSDLLTWLGSGQWSNWLAPARSVLLLPMSAPVPDAVWQPLARVSDIVCIPDAHQAPAPVVADRWLALRQIGPAGQVRINAPLSGFVWPLAENALGSAIGAL